MGKFQFYLRTLRSKKIILGVAIILLCSISFFFLQKRPMVYLYAWERSENFLFLKNTHHVGVAYFALQIELYDDHITSYRRTTDLVIPKHITSFPVVRIDMKSKAPQRYEIALSMIADLCNKSTVHMCQVDFDITKSQETFFKIFMNQLSLRIHKDVVMTATALPYKCYSGDFYHDVPIAYAVPLLVNVGADDAYLTSQTKKHDIFLGEKCTTAIGVSTYESQYVPSYFKGREVYLFSNTPWTESLFKKIVSRYSLQ